MTKMLVMMMVMMILFMIDDDDEDSLRKKQMPVKGRATCDTQAIIRINHSKVLGGRGEQRQFINTV